MQNIYQHVSLQNLHVTTLDIFLFVKTENLWLDIL